MPSGGPNGAGDAYLLNESDGSGSQGRIQIRNTDQWSGDYGSEGVTRISLFALNPSDTDLDLRLAIGNPVPGDDNNPASRGTWYASAIGVSLLAGTDWTEVVFDLTDEALTLVQGTDSLADVLSAVTHLRILSAAEPANRGDRVAGAIGIDDITAAPEPSAAVLTTLALVGLGCARRRRD